MATYEDISTIATPTDVTVAYGMNAENLSAFCEEYMEWYEPPTVGVQGTTYYTDTLESLSLVVIIVALLLPVRRRLDISEMKMFSVPFEVPVLLWLFIFAAELDFIPVQIVEATISGTILPGMGHGMEILATALNFVMWFFIFGLIFWSVTSLRAMIRMKGAYWRERTLTMKLIRHYRGKGTESDEAMVKKAGGIIKRVKAFLAKQYDALQHIDFRRRRTGRSLRS